MVRQYLTDYPGTRREPPENLRKPAVSVAGFFINTLFSKKKKNVYQ